MFASPSASSVLSAVRALAGPPGCLLIVKNYTGDRLNFGIAMEQAREAGVACEMVIVGDDCALPDKGITGRRGVAGTLLVHKLAGATARAGKSLEEVASVARAAAASIGTMGVALTGCTLPGAARNQRLDGDRVEIGLGIHGEPGARQQRWARADALVDAAVAAILDEPTGPGGAPYLQLRAGAQVAVMLNSLGATSPMEMAVLARRLLSTLAARGVVVARFLQGPLMTSLDMLGFSVSLLALESATLPLLDAPTKAPAWPHVADLTAPPAPVLADPGAVAAAAASPATGARLKASSLASQRIRAAAEALIAAEADLTRWDSLSGDGDCGITVKRGALRVLADLPNYAAGDAECARGVAESVKASMGGSSGALLEILFRAMATALAQGASTAAALARGVEAVQFYGGASQGFRTLVDALAPAAAALAAGQDLTAAAAAAQQGADATKTMDALAGRANWVSPELYRDAPDPGAAAVALALQAMAQQT